MPSVLSHLINPFKGINREGVDIFRRVLLSEISKLSAEMPSTYSPKALFSAFVTTLAIGLVNIFPKSDFVGLVFRERGIAAGRFPTGPSYECT